MTAGCMPGTGGAAARGRKVHDLCEGGARIEVTDANKASYIKARVQWMTRDRAPAQTDALCKVLHALGLGFWLTRLL